MIHVTIGKIDLVSDNLISLNNKTVMKIEIPNVSNNIWAFRYDEETQTGEIEYQDSSNNNLQVTSLSQLESEIGCSLQSIKDIHADNWVEPNG